MKAVRLVLPKKKVQVLMRVASLEDFILDPTPPAINTPNKPKEKDSVAKTKKSSVQMARPYIPFPPMMLLKSQKMLGKKYQSKTSNKIRL